MSLAATPRRQSGGPLDAAKRLTCRLADQLAALAMLGLLALAVATVVDVLGRYLFASPLRGFSDIASLSGAVLLSACMPYVVARRANITVDFLGQRLGPRSAARLDGFGALLCAIFFALMAWQYARFALELHETQQLMAILRWPVWPWWSAVTVFILLSAIAGLLTLNAAPAVSGARPLQDTDPS